MSLNQLWECKSTLSNVCYGSLSAEVQKRKGRTTAQKLIALRSRRRYPNVSRKTTAFIYRSSALEQSDAGGGIGRYVCRLCVCNVTLHVHFHGPYFDQFLWLAPDLGIRLHGDGLEPLRERCRLFVEVSDMIADLIHGQWVLLGASFILMLMFWKCTKFMIMLALPTTDSTHHCCLLGCQYLYLFDRSLNFFHIFRMFNWALMILSSFHILFYSIYLNSILFFFLCSCCIFVGALSAHPTVSCLVQMNLNIMKVVMSVPWLHFPSASAITWLCHMPSWSPSPVLCFTWLTPLFKFLFSTAPIQIRWSKSKQEINEK